MHVTSSPRPRIFVGIFSRHNNTEQRQAVRDTWLSRSVEGIDCRFVVGAGAPLVNEPDTIVVPVSENGDFLPEKVLCFFARALEASDFEWLFRCDDDTYLVLDRLRDLIPVSGEMVCSEALGHCDTPTGGAGYLLARRIVEKLVVDSDLPAAGAEDAIIAGAAIKHGATPAKSRLLRGNSIPYPHISNGYVTAHSYSPERLQAIHTLLHETPARSFHAVHQLWEDQLDLFDNGTFGRRLTGCTGRWSEENDGVLHLAWTNSVEDTAPAGNGGYFGEDIFLIPQETLNQRVLVFSSIGDDERAVLSWLGGPNDVAVVYHGDDPRAGFPSTIRKRVDYFAARKGAKFPNLVWWLDENPHVIRQYDRFLVIDDDLALSDESLAILVREAVVWDLPVCSPSHDPKGKISWRHMAKKPNARLAFCNFVEMGCVLFERDALIAFLDRFRPYAETLAGFGTDYIIQDACFDSGRPFGVVHSISVYNPCRDLGRGIVALQDTATQSTSWATVASQFKTKTPFELSDIKTYNIEGTVDKEGPSPLIVCISLKRAAERRLGTLQRWKPILGNKLRLADAIDRRDIEQGSVVPPLPHGIHPAIRRKLTTGETACLMSHLAVLKDHCGRIGPEGIIVMEDDINPLPDASLLFALVCKARQEAPRVDMLLLCQPVNSPRIAAETLTVQIAAANDYPYGTTMVWYGPKAIEDYITRMSSFDAPADYRLEFCQEGRVGILKRPVAVHRGDDTYVGNDHSWSQLQARNLQVNFKP